MTSPNDLTSSCDVIITPPPDEDVVMESFKRTFRFWQYIPTKTRMLSSSKVHPTATVTLRGTLPLTFSIMLPPVDEAAALGRPVDERLVVVVSATDVDRRVVGVEVGVVVVEDVIVDVAVIVEL